MLQEKIVSQLRKYEVPYEKFVVGAKFQHLLLNQDLTAVSYDEEKGIADLLEYLIDEYFQTTVFLYPKMMKSLLRYLGISTFPFSTLYGYRHFLSPEELKLFQKLKIERELKTLMRFLKYLMESWLREET